MGGGGGGGGDARRMEEERQAEVEAGLREVDKIFAGFEGMNFNPAYATWEGAKPLESQFTSSWEEEVGNNNRRETRTAFDEAGYNRAVDEWKASAPDEYLSGGPNLYDQYAKTYLDYYNPQVTEQAESAREKLFFDAARRGMSESSAYIDKKADLEEAVADAMVDIQNQSKSAQNQYRSDIEGQKQNLYSQVQAGLDPTSAANLAQSTYSSLSARTPQMTALGDLFSAYSNLSAQNLALQAAGQPGYATKGGVINPFASRAGTGAVK